VGRELTATPFAGGGGGGASGIAERDVWLSTLHRDAPLADSNTRKEITESCYMTAVGEIHALLDESQVYPDARNAMPLPERQRKADECIARALRVAAEGGGFASSSSSLSATGFQDMLFGMLRDEGHKQVCEREERFEWSTDSRSVFNHNVRLSSHSAISCARKVFLSLP